jgi:N-acetylglucosamine-6-sulfatase
VQTCETLRDVDRSVQSIMAEMRKVGRYDNTYFVFMSDNGYGFGEHRLVGKGDLYEESVRVPLWVRGPGVKPGPISRLTSNIDITPTFVDWAQAKAPKGFFDGQSFAGNLDGKTGTNPQAILLRGCRTNSTQGSGTGFGGQETQACGAYPEPMGLNWGLRTPQYKYIDSNTFTQGKSLQLFDLRKDPWELNNLAYQPGYQDVVKQLAAELARMHSS